MSATGSESPDTVVTYVVRSLRADIVDGKYLAGQRLDQQGLARGLGVSIIPVREALRQLQTEGLAQSVPRRGWFVPRISVGQIAEVFMIRAALEPLATAEAVKRATPDVVRRLERLMEEMTAVVGDTEMSRWDDLNREFHFTIYEASNAETLVQMIGNLWDQYRLSRMTYIRNLDNRAKSMSHHLAIYDAFQARRPGRAAGAMRRHLMAAAADQRLSARNSRRRQAAAKRSAPDIYPIT